jgi:hypothetical protein
VESDSVEEILKKAGKAVESLPEHLQGKAFELAVSMLTEGVAPSRGAPSASRPSESVRHPSAAYDTDLPDVSDMLRACKRNPDRYLVFIQELEAKGLDATTASMTECFRTYRQDTPKLPARDLAEMVAKGLIEQLGKGREATFALKRKGRERIAQLAAAVGAE